MKCVHLGHESGAGVEEEKKPSINVVSTNGLNSGANIELITPTPFNYYLHQKPQSVGPSSSQGFHVGTGEGTIVPTTGSQNFLSANEIGGNLSANAAYVSQQHHCRSMASHSGIQPQTSLLGAVPGRYQVC